MSRRLYNADRKLMRDRARAGLCVACGGNEFVQAVDNTGQSYEGCARCTIVLLPDVVSRAKRDREGGK